MIHTYVQILNTEKWPTHLPAYFYDVRNTFDLLFQARTKRPASKPKFRKAQSFDVEDDVLGPDRHFPEEYNIPIQQHRSDSNLFNTTTRGGRRKFKMSSFEASQSLTDIYGRISSYQSLLKPFKCEADSEVSVAMPMNRSFRYLETEL